MGIKVSICIPAYKQIEHLRRTLHSVHEQTFPDYELIVTDDTPENSVKVLLSEFDFKGKLRYFHNAPSLGSPGNWNYAIQQAKGEYIKLLHHDDFFTSPESLSKYVALLDNNPAADFGFSTTEIWKLDGNSRSYNYISRRDLRRLCDEPEYLFFVNLIGAPSATIYRNRVNVPYDTNLKWLVDVEAYIRILKKNKNAVHERDPLVCTVDGASGQITQSVINNLELQIKEHVYLFNKIKPNKAAKYSLFFQLLFEKFNVRSWEELAAICDVPRHLEPFFVDVFKSGKRNNKLKKLIGFLYESKLNRYYLKLKRF